VTTLLEMHDVVVGTLHEEGNSYSFEYSDQWLTHGFELGPDVPLARGRQFSRKAFGFMEDASPDRWGRTLMLRQTRADLKKKKQPARTLTALDYLLGVNDESRLGALRVRQDSRYLAFSAGPPPLVHLGTLLRASNDYQSGAYDDETLALLLAPGSSLGGARPKASVRDARGDLFVAKFPKADDEYSVERWEFIALQLARRAGCQVAEARIEIIDGQGVLLSKRFDRKGDHRIHFSSAMNLLELTDGDSSSYASTELGAIFPTCGAARIMRGSIAHGP
jgi:serine/threonine-protein kinase HipA